MKRKNLKTIIIFIAFLFPVVNLIAQPLYKVLTLTDAKPESKKLFVDEGLAGTWQKLLKLQTTASVMHTQAHPDDEQADLLTWLSRGKGVRTSLLSLTRGESGGNILGVEFFDELALLRTEEFLLAANYYGLDDLYFTNLVDYGFSKRVEEAYKKWGREKVLEEMVRVIRVNRPMVIISRFHGTKRDGHGNHQAAGEISPEAFIMAADPKAFPEQIIKEGLRPWKTLKFYRGGVKADEHFNLALNTGAYSSWLGESYKNFSLLGYSFHRSQFGGQRNQVNGPFHQYYERLHSYVNSEEKETGFFDGIDISLSGIFKVTGENAPAGVMPLLELIQKIVDTAIGGFTPSNPTSIIPFLTKGLTTTRSALSLLNKQPDAYFILKIKERQFMDAINTVLGITLQATAVPHGTKETASFYAPPPTMGFVIPGQSFKVNLSFVNGSIVPVIPDDVKIIASPDFKISNKESKKFFLNNGKLDETFLVTVPVNAHFSDAYYHRNSLMENKYKYDDDGNVNLPNNKPALMACATYFIDSVLVEIQKPVEVTQSDLPYGYNNYTVKLAPPLVVNISPKTVIVPLNSQIKEFNIYVELINNKEAGSSGKLELKLPAGWKASSLTMPFTFTRAGERTNFSFKVTMPMSQPKIYEIKAVATVNGKSYSEGYKLINHRDLEQTVIYYPAVSKIKAIDVKIKPGLHIGYVMGVGDEVPDAVKQLGASVQLLTTDDLSKAKLDKFNAIVIGTRAYAVRKDLNTYNLRLLQYAKNGGHLIVLFQTPEFIPDQMAAYPADLPGNPEEVSEEDSPIKILNAGHRVLNFPNKITAGDFENWVEQRGSKFFSKWDSHYTPIISTQDIGQLPQGGGWLMAPYGKGHYTYFAYSFHRQLPYGITGAYRIFANLLSYGN